MKKSIVQRIYNDEAGPGERFMVDDAECRGFNRKIGDDYEYFRARLSSEDWSRFESMEDTMSKRLCACNYANFAHGFQLGIGLMVEVFAGMEDTGA